jgi:hypothetical protein
MHPIVLLILVLGVVGLLGPVIAGIFLAVRLSSRRTS